MKKWLMIGLTMLLVGFGVFWFSGKQLTLTFKDGVWYHDGETQEEFNEELLNGVESIKIIASGETRMEHFAELLWFSTNRPNVDLILEDLTTKESVLIEGLSTSDRVVFDSKVVAFSKIEGYESGEDLKDYSQVGIAGNVLGAHFTNFNYSYAHLDGRGLEKFKKSFDSEQDWYLGLGSLDETTLDQFIKGTKVFKETGAKIVPIVDNRFMMAVFSEIKVGDMVDADGGIIQESPETKRLEDGGYELQPEDFPKDLDMPHIELVERDLPMTLPTNALPKGGLIEPLLLRVMESGKCMLNLEEFELTMEQLRERLNDYSSKCQAKGSKPMIQFYVSPECKQEKVVDVLNEIRGANINTVTFTDEEFDEEDMKPQEVVLLDKEVMPSVAYNEINVDDKSSRIIINVRDDGSYSQEDFKEVMKTTEELQAYIKKQKKMLGEIDASVEPKVHLRGTKNALFEHSQVVIKAAAQAGVDKIVFSVFPFKEEKEISE